MVSFGDPTPSVEFQLTPPAPPPPPPRPPGTSLVKIGFKAIGQPLTLFKLIAITLFHQRNYINLV